MCIEASVVIAHRANYANPIRFKAGEKVIVGKRDEEYPGWIWTTLASGNSGWAPEELLSMSGASAVALADYDATELTTEAGERVRVVFEMLEWAWIRNSAGREGWVPLNTLQRLP